MMDKRSSCSLPEAHRTEVQLGQIPPPRATRSHAADRAKLEVLPAYPAEGLAAVE
jgi:hypothetical protein